MSETELSIEPGRWLRYAEEDLRVAEAFQLRSDTAPRYACFYAQQAAEIAIKAALAFTQTEAPSHHDLDALRDLVPAGWELKHDHPSLGELTVWAEALYPGPLPDPTDDEAATAIRQARGVLASVTRDLAQHGLTDAPNDAAPPSPRVGEGAEGEDP